MATRGVTCSYQEVIDLHTEPDHVTVIGIHTPTGDTPRKMFRGFFDQYKKYKYLGASVSLVPAARLPADMLQVSYEAGDYIDPRDTMNPVMFHGCHGDDMGTILNRMYNAESVSDSIVALDLANDTQSIENYENDFLERLYYKALTDNTWKKAHPQRGFRKSGLHPLIYSLATNRQLMPGSNVSAMIGVTGNQLLTAGAVGDPELTELGGSQADGYSADMGIENNMQFFTPSLTSLGWMDTRNEITQAVSSDLDSGATNLVEMMQTNFVMSINYAELPKLYMGVILLSKLYKVAQYYRMIINHRFAFKDFRSISFMPEQSGVPSYFNANTDDGIFEPETFSDIDISPGGGTGQVTTLQNIYVTVQNNLTSSTSAKATLHIGGTELSYGSPVSIAAGSSYVWDFDSTKLSQNGYPAGTQVYATIGNPVVATSEVITLRLGDVGRSLTIVRNSSSKGEVDEEGVIEDDDNVKLD